MRKRNQKKSAESEAMPSSAFGISTSATGAPFFDAGASWPQGAEVTVSGSQKGGKKKSCKSTGDIGKIRKKESAECILIDKKAKSCKISFVLPSLLAFSGLQCTKGLPSKTRKESGSAVE